MFFVVKRCSAVPLTSHKTEKKAHEKIFYIQFRVFRLCTLPPLLNSLHSLFPSQPEKHNIIAVCFHFPQSAFRQHSNILAFGKNRNKRNRKKKWEACESVSRRRIEIKDICRPPIMDAKLRSEIYIFSQGDRNKHNRAEKRHQTTMRNGWGSRRRHLPAQHFESVYKVSQIVETFLWLAWNVPLLVFWVVFIVVCRKNSARRIKIYELLLTWHFKVIFCRVRFLFV